MPSSLEIILPLRNPTEILRQTIASLVTQTNRNFSILLSGNFSDHETEFIAHAEVLLESGGIPVHVVRPPKESSDVEHWNWLHYRATGEWLKPLRQGDWLEPEYVAKVRAAMSAEPRARLVFANYTLHQGAQTIAADAVLKDGFYAGAEMRAGALRHGRLLGPPGALAYLRDAFIAVGGLRTTLPSCAFDLLTATLAGSDGAFILAERLCHCLGSKETRSVGESVTATSLLAYHAWTDNFSIPRVALARRLAREMFGQAT